MKPIALWGLLFAGVIGQSARADDLVRLNISPKNSEGLCFARTDEPKVDALCYFIGDRIEKTKAISGEERTRLFKELRDLLPAQSSNRVCSMPVNIETIDSKGLKTTQNYCLEEMSSKRRLKFRNWFTKTRALLQPRAKPDGK